MKKSTILWDWGTAYDLFCSLRVLHDPRHYGLRPSWAAGVRSRIPLEHRDILEKVQKFVFIPKKWIYELPSAKDTEAVIWFLGQIQPENRLITLVEACGVPLEVTEILRNISYRCNYTNTDLESLREAYQVRKLTYRQKDLTTLMELFLKSYDSGMRYLAALKAYQKVFFEEEESHIWHYLKESLSHAKQLAEQLPLDDLIESLSRGVRLNIETSIEELIFVPSYWISPLVSFDRMSDRRAIFVFGGRPPDVSLVPGEVFPDGVLRAFKALGDPTRLRILKYLAQENITQAEISRRLRLRAPTVTHHLSLLRLAGLVYLKIDEKNERYYAARIEAIENLFDSLKTFLVESSDRVIEE